MCNNYEFELVLLFFYINVLFDLFLNKIIFLLIKYFFSPEKVFFESNILLQKLYIFDQFFSKYRS